MSTTPPGGDAHRVSPYDTVTIRDVFLWLDGLRGWDIATHVEYEALRDVAMTRLDALEAALAASEKKAARLQTAVRHHCDHRAGDIGRRQGLRGPEIVQLAHDLASGAGLHPGDIDVDVRRMAVPQRGREQA